MLSIFFFTDGGAKAAALTNALIYMIVKDDLPLNTPEKEGYRYFMSVAAPLFKTPGRSKMTATLDAKYEVLSELVKKKLLRLSGFTLTADVWTETMSFTSFLGCTIHFVDDDKLTAIVLNVTELNERHSSAYLSQIFLSTCSDWGIPLNKITAVVTDNGANIVKAVSDTFGAHRHLPCFAHSLNLVVTRVIEASDSVKNLISQVKTIVTYFKQSTTAADELRKSQNNNAPLRLIQDVATRWNSTFYMLERFLELIDTVSSVLLKLPKSPPMLTASEVAIARELIKVLAPIEIVSREMCGENYVTSSRIIPTIYCLNKSIDHVGMTSPIAQTFKIDILKELKKRFTGIELNPLFAVSTVLDPRFGQLHFSSAISCSKGIEQINTLLKSETLRNHEVIEREESGTATASKYENDRLWKFHLQLVEEKKTYKTNVLESAGIHPDLKQYLSRETISLDADPIKYLIERKENTPQLASIALKYLSIIATSVPCERVFSVAKNIATPNRNRLSPDRLSRVLFLKSLSFSDWSL